MKKHNDKLDSLVNKIMNQVPLEKPSNDFTSQLMSKINVAKPIVYEPLISNRTWLFLLVFMLVVLVLIFTNKSTSQSSIMDIINFKSIFQNQFTNYFSNLRFSKIVLYAIVFFTAMIFIQIPFLKHQFDKQLHA